MAVKLSVPDMSSLATLMPGRESTITVPAGLRVLIAVPDPARTSLMVSPSSANAVTLSTIASGSPSDGLQFPTGIKSPHLITWDIYGSKLQDPWYLHNLGATDLQVTTIEVVSRPLVSSMPISCDKSSLQPLKSCLPRFKVPIYPPPIDDIVPSPGGGPSCETSDVIGGNPVFLVASPGGGNRWWKREVTAGSWKIVVNVERTQSGTEGFAVFQGSCSGLFEVAQFSLGPGENFTICINLGLNDGFVWVEFRNFITGGFESTALDFSVIPGAC